MTFLELQQLCIKEIKKSLQEKSIKSDEMVEVLVLLNSTQNQDELEAVIKLFHKEYRVLEHVYNLIHEGTKHIDEEMLIDNLKSNLNK